MHRSNLVPAMGLAAVVAVTAACGGTSSPAPTPVPTASAAAAAPAAATPTLPPVAMALTIENDACSYQGPTSIPYGPYAVTFDVRETRYPQNGWFVFTLDAGRSLEEARAVIESEDETTEPPAWLTMLTIHPFGGTPGAAETWQEDLRQMGAYTHGPIYILCARPDHVYDIFGPIEVMQ